METYMCSPQERHKIALEIVAEIADVLLGVLPDYLELPDMGLTLNMAFD
jgi:hypothetical protein